MKKIWLILALMVAFVMLCGCSGYVKSYSATILITSTRANKASMEFKTFNGTYNFKLKRQDTSEHTLNVKATLAEGGMNIYVGVDGGKDFLRTIMGGESCNETIALDAKYDDEKAIYVIVETIDRCKDGDFEFKYS